MAGEPKLHLFGEIAVEQGLLSQAQVDEALAIQRQLRAKGVQKTLGAVLHDKQYLTLVQINQVSEKIEDVRRRHSIEGYEIISRLGKGGMGAVYLAKQLSLGKLVAVKVLPPKLASNADYLKRFQREATATAKLNHPNIVGAYDVGESNGYNYFVMEYVDGETVKDLLARTGVIDEARALELTTQVADALAHAWQQGIVHRDVKPANIMITKAGQAKLCDLGLAIDRKEDHSITRSGVIMGTPYYLSPEQARSEALDIRSDIYSLGATLFHMITGSVPYEGETPAVILTKHLNDPPPDPLARNPLLSRGICFIVTTMMAKAADRRYQTPEALLQDLRELRERSFLRGKTYVPDAARPSGAPVARALGRNRAAIGLAAAVVAIGSVAWLAAVSRDPELPGRIRARMAELWRGREGLISSLPRVDDRSNTALSEAKEAEREATRLLDEADRYAAAHPADPEGARDLYAALARKYDASGAALPARAKIASLNNKIDRDAKSTFFALAVEARAARDEGRFAAALAALDRFPERWRATAWGKQTEREREIVVQAAQARLADMRARAKEREAAGDFVGAAAEVEPALAFGVEPVVLLASAEKARLLQRATAAGQAAARATSEEADARFAGALAEVVAAMRQDGGVRKAASRAAELAARADLQASQPSVAALSGDVAALARAEGALAERLSGLVSKEVRLRVAGAERAGVLDAVRDGALLLHLGAATMRYRLDEVDVAEWLSPALAGGPAGAARLQGVLHLLRGEDEDARRALGEAARLGEDVRIYAAHLARDAAARGQ